MAATLKKPGEADVLSPTIIRITTIKAIPAVHIIIDDRIAVPRSLAARSSYLFMTARLQDISAGMP